ncbi:MAG: hypothetical protein HYT75_01505 [Deltaproteobacteria bacterium]|nr:hypothetical protein [Deltaproteobacteria bacterium]
MLPVSSPAKNVGAENAKDIIIKSPDGISGENKISLILAPNFNEMNGGSEEEPVYPIYGDNANYMVNGDFFGSGGWPDDIAVKGPNGSWKIFEGWTAWGWGFLDDPIYTPIESEPKDIYGDILCRPNPADYDDDGKDDRVVQCGTSWKIVYSSSNQVREIELDQALDPVPAYVYAGGIKYQDTVDLYNYYKEDLSGTKDSTIFDAPPPIGPYFAQCVKYWAPNASYCWNK